MWQTFHALRCFVMLSALATVNGPNKIFAVDSDGHRVFLAAKRAFEGGRERVALIEESEWRLMYKTEE